MVKCIECYYWDWDWFDDGEEFQSCLYWFYTQEEIYPSLESGFPDDEYEDWDCKYFRSEKNEI